MNVRKVCAALQVGLIVLALAACGGPTSALPARSLSVELIEFTISPSSDLARVGEPLTFVVTNAGVLDHDLTIVDVDGEQYAHVAVKAGQTVSFDFQPATAAEFQLLCSITGHAQAGMSAQMTVVP